MKKLVRRTSYLTYPAQLELLDFRSFGRDAKIRHLMAFRRIDLAADCIRPAIRKQTSAITFNHKPNSAILCDLCASAVKIPSATAGLELPRLHHRHMQARNARSLRRHRRFH